MKLIVGLGNYGNEYAKTRHNVGFMVVDLLAQNLNCSFNSSKFNADIATTNIKTEKVLIVKPLTYMNLSGEAVMAIANFYKIDNNDIIIIHDDLDLPSGSVRIRKNGSAGGQKGMKNIIDLLKSQDIARIRIGIGKNPLIPVIDYVLGKIPTEEKETMDKAFDTSCSACKLFCTSDIDLVMNRYNKR